MSVPIIGWQWQTGTMVTTSQSPQPDIFFPCWLAVMTLPGFFDPPPETSKQRTERLASEKRAQEFGAKVLPLMQAAHQRGQRR
jgi:hypothetical protein